MLDKLLTSELVAVVDGLCQTIVFLQTQLIGHSARMLSIMKQMFVRLISSSMERISQEIHMQGKGSIIKVIDASELAMRSSTKVYQMKIEQGTGITLRIGLMALFQLKVTMSTLNQDGIWFST
jgi:hypothetical protein